MAIQLENIVEYDYQTQTGDTGSTSKNKINGNNTKIAEELSRIDSAKVENTTKVNGHALTGDISVTKNDVGLGSVDNTADIDKPVSNAQQNIFNTKTDKTTQVIAGNGLTGGGDLSTDRTINIAASDDSIVIAADGIKVDTQNSLTSTSPTKPLAANQGKILDGKITQLSADLNQKSSKLDLTQKLNAVKIVSGNNLLNRNYTEPVNPQEYEKGGANRLINETTGVVINATAWYLSPLIDWQTNTQAIIYTCRCWAQYAEDGATLKGIYYPTGVQSNLLIEKATDAKYIRVGLGVGVGNCMMNFGNTLLPFEPYVETVLNRIYGNTPIYFNPLFKDMLLSESYIPQSPTYTDGVVNSPINVIWVDGDAGTLTLTRNSDGLVTKIVATKIHSGVTLTLTENITRDSDGNVTLISIV